MYVNKSHASLSSFLVGDAVVGMPRRESARDGLVDIYEAALEDADPPTALARLRGHAFVSGALQTWADETRLAQITLHRFATQHGAQLAATEQAHALLASAGVAFTINSEPSAFGASIYDVESDFTAHVGVVAVHCVLVVVLVGGPDTSTVDVGRVLQEQCLLLQTFRPSTRSGFPPIQAPRSWCSQVLP